jgi:hypothetical protein
MANMVCEFCGKWEDRCECEPISKRHLQRIATLETENTRLKESEARLEVSASCWEEVHKTVPAALEMGAKHGLVFGYSGTERIAEELLDLCQKLTQERDEAYMRGFVDGNTGAVNAISPAHTKSTGILRENTSTD